MYPLTEVEPLTEIGPLTKMHPTSESWARGAVTQLEPPTQYLNNANLQVDSLSPQKGHFYFTQTFTSEVHIPQKLDFYFTQAPKKSRVTNNLTY
jgi:hypothetical protein